MSPIGPYLPPGRTTTTLFGALMTTPLTKKAIFHDALAAGETPTAAASLAGIRSRQVKSHYLKQYRLTLAAAEPAPDRQDPPYFLDPERAALSHTAFVLWHRAHPGQSLTIEDFESRYPEAEWPEMAILAPGALGGVPDYPPILESPRTDLSRKSALQPKDLQEPKSDFPTQPSPQPPSQPVLPNGDPYGRQDYPDQPATHWRQHLEDNQQAAARQWRQEEE